MGRYTVRSRRSRQRAIQAATNRKRAQRTRERQGRIVVRVEADEAALCTALVDGGFISVNDQIDKQKLNAALSRVIEIILTADLMSRVTPFECKRW
jgi:hypothetical protein